MSGAPSNVSAGTGISSDRASGERGDAVARAHDDAELAQRVLLIAETLRILLRSHHVSNDGQLPTAQSRAVACVREHGGESAGGIGMSTVTEDHVEQEHRDVGLARRIQDGCVPAARINDRMRAAPRELLGAEVHEAVAATDEAL